MMMMTTPGTCVPKDANPLYDFHAVLNLGNKNVKDLIEILSWCRGAGTNSEAEFVKQFIATIPNAWADDYGNYHVTVGENPIILWSGHTDTVTRKEGRQNVKWIGKGMLGLNNAQAGQCLGADDGAGLWIMFDLIKAGKPGHYVFHRDEEIGGLGSLWISKNDYVLPKGLKAAIAMDRNGPRDIITHQGYQRTASDEFAMSMAGMLPLGMEPDDGGVFTDTANYVDIIGECTNLACGYERNHGPNETLDTNHLRRLRDCLLALDYDKLVFKREAGSYEYASWTNYAGGASTYMDGTDKWAGDYEQWLAKEDIDADAPFTDEPLGNMTSYMDMVEEAPDVAARLLDECGITRDEFRAHVFAIHGRLIGA